MYFEKSCPIRAILTEFEAMQYLQYLEIFINVAIFINFYSNATF